MNQGEQNLREKALAVFRTNLGALNDYLHQPDVQEIMINNPKQIWIERSGKYEKLDLSLSPEAIQGAITALANLNSKSTTAVLDCRLPHLRIAATLPPIAVHGPSMSIRRHSAKVIDIEEYLERGLFDPVWNINAKSQTSNRPTNGDVARGGRALADFLTWCIESRHNIIVAGSTSSGKTTLLNMLVALIPLHYRIGTIEDTAELQIDAPNYFAFEANRAKDIDIRSLVKHMLRYRPDRVIIGEIRGAEAFDMLDAYNTGHPGSLVSFHADSAELALARLENMIRMAPEAANWPLEDVRRQIASTFRFVVHATHIAGQRGPNEVIEVAGVENGRYVLHSLFKKTISYH